MAKYLNNKGKQRFANLCENLQWDIEEIDEDDEDFEESITEQWIAVYPSQPAGVGIGVLFEDVNPLYPDDSSCAKYVKLYYNYADDDTLGLHPIATQMTYPAYISEKELNTPWYEEFEREVSLNKDEIAYFTGLLQKAIGDNHSPEMQEIMVNYYNSVDKEVKNFVQDAISGREVLPLTVGFVTEKMAKDMQVNGLTGLNTLVGNRIVISDNVARHIFLNCHGTEGQEDNGIRDTDDIARLCYVLSNYDSIEWDGKMSDIPNEKWVRSPQIAIKKRIDEAYYYIVRVASDSRKNRILVTSVCLKSATD